ncbi:queuosine biosynthesis ATPase [Escherichia phage ECP2304]|nr:queuosine biosynthesis ATPase [Escherichia phage ECP2304]
MNKLDKLVFPVKNHNSAVVVLSGGQDSVTCLGLALNNYDKVYAIGFAYGQRHNIELACANQICKEHDVPFVVFELPALKQIGNSALIGDEGDVNEHHEQHNNLPASFVPNRNALFLTTAHAYAQKVGARYVVTGVCETDYSGYPDCRQQFVDLLEATLNVGYETDIHFVTPLMRLNKAETFELADKVGFLTTVIEQSHTCYNGVRRTLHDWGYGCGECPACKLRAKGYSEFMDNAYSKHV